MPHSFRAGRFTSRKMVGEDVNPSAYIVNLADCMLVLAVGVIVALVSYWNIDIAPVEELQQEDLEEIDPETLPEELGSGGSFYQEAGIAYRDPSTGALYLLTEVPEDEGSESDAGEGSEVVGEDAAQSGNSDEEI